MEVTSEASITRFNSGNFFSVFVDKVDNISECFI